MGLNSLNRPLLSLMAATLPLSVFAADQARLYNPDPATWFEVSGRQLDFKTAPLFDLRRLNEEIAGQKGRVTMRDGKLYLGDGTPVRFFGNATGKFLGDKPLDEARTRASIDSLLTFMANNGMNMHRLRARPLFLGEDPLVPDASRLDAMFYTVAEAKKRGIYTLLSPFFPLTNPLTGDNQVAGYKADGKPFGILYFSPEMQEIYKGQIKTLLTTRNPHTGMTLAEDPALAIIELVNEDNLFFFTMNPKSVPPEQWAIIEKRFGAWLAERFGSLEKALATFDKGPTDSVEKGTATFFAASALTRQSIARAAPDRRARLEAQAEFMTSVQRRFFEEMLAYCRGLGAKCVFIASNWRTADPALTDALERYSYTAADMTDMHRYYSAQKKGGPAWLVIHPASYKDHTALRDPGTAPLQFFDYAGRADGISEINWSHPNYYRAEFLPMVGAYGSLAGLDMIMPFSFGAGGVAPALPWNVNEASTPITVASLPATVLMFRQRYIDESEPVVRQTLSLKDLYALKGAFAGAQGEDAARDTGDHEENASADATGFPPLAFFAGKVERSFTEGKGSVQTRDLSGLIDEKGKLIKSATGQLSWDYGRGLLLINAPKAQGAVGFLAETGPATLPALSVDVKNTYAHVLLVSLDNQPLATSKRMLLQVVTGERPKTWASEADAGGRTKITALVPKTVAEKDPWMIESPVGTVEFGRALKFTPLDIAGHASARAAKSSGTTLKLDPRTLLYLIEAP